MRLLLVFIVTAITACGSSDEKEKDIKIPGDTVVTNIPVTDTADKPMDKQSQPASLLSKVVNGLLDAKFEGKWRVVNDSIAKWPQDVFDYFVVNGRKKDKEYPYIVKGDFNGDGENDVAALVKESNGEDLQLAIILRSINKTDKTSYHFWNEDIDMAALEAYPKGEIMNLDAKPVKMLGDGITVEYYEKASFVIYWDGKAFKRVYTSD
ncbi:MAG TPA: hypothetical protein VMZ03_12615 [Chitinophagaceae bacterium]|nr:hypothetical protein [Chitinophagaceae bacterium]